MTSKSTILDVKKEYQKKSMYMNLIRCVILQAVFGISQVLFNCYAICCICFNVYLIFDLFLTDPKYYITRQAFKVDPSMYVHQIVGEYQSFYKMNKMDIKIFHNCENFNKCNLQSALRVNYYLIKF